MKKVLFFAALAACLFTACQKEMNAPAGTTLTASILQTRTSLQSDMKVFWSAGDQIFVNGQVSKPVTAAGASASFQFDAALAAPFKAVYPAAFTQDGLSLTLPAEQAAADGTFADGVAPMLASTESGNTLQFKHVAAYIRVPVKSAKTITSVTFSGNEGEQVCGSFGINWDEGFLIDTDATEENQSVKVLVGKSAATLVIAVPARTYYKGFTLKAEDADGKVMTYTKVSATELVAGQVNTLPEVVFEPVPEGAGSGTEADPYLIKTAEDLAAMYTKVVKGQMTYFKMVDNIDMSSISEWTPVNVDFANENGAEGIMFDGNHKVISNWHYVNTTSKYPGFVAVLHGEVKNVVFADCVVENSVGSPCGLVCGWNGVSNASLHGHIEDVHAVRCQVISTYKTSNVGGIAGSAHNAEFINCTFDGLVERRCEANSNDTEKNSYRPIGGILGQVAQKGDDMVKMEGCSTSGSLESGNGRGAGGLIGTCNGSAVIHLKNCHSTMYIHSKHDVIGGLVGYWAGGTLDHCWYEGIVVNETATNKISYMGGLVGHTNLGIVFTNCHSAGRIEGPGQIVGGILGQSNAAATATPVIFKECWSTMTVIAGGSTIGGICGRGSANQPLTIENCWYSGEIVGGKSTAYVGGILGDGPKNTTVTNCWTDAQIESGYGTGGVCGRLFGRQGSSADVYGDMETAMTGCIYWGPSLRTNTEGGEKCSNHYSSGAMVGFASRPTTFKDNYRPAVLTFDYQRYAPLNTLFDHADSNPATPLVQPYNFGDAPITLSEAEGDIEDFKYYSPYHGKAAPENATISSLAKTIGWDEAIWDLSGDKPMLKNNPKE